MEFTIPTIDLALIGPMLALVVAAIVLILLPLLLAAVKQELS